MFYVRRETAVNQWDDVRELWSGSLAPIPAHLVGPHVSAGTAAFLIAVGLPIEHPLEFTFYHDERLLNPAVRGERTFIVFGDDTGTVPFAIERGREEVFSLYPDGPFMFINSTIADFVYCYGLFSQRVERIVQTPFADRKPLVDELRGLIAARDPEALDPDDLLAWWDSLLEPYEQ
ncbi:SUKH-4 family immunity protein [Nocardia amamiensis]|uniref:SUKH-4 family immunity protein n=1 Tax=Nocardia amamiensis TaxID=404578 RepID=A0ABS0CS36_9NOCA|nr:SUKH-4 family immunity protein [Nocardia amamiensis]MBF6299392.1 SUKH-4 family immunity protein [Nocardia amamiensis]